jgi:hypothetical protein
MRLRTAAPIANRLADDKHPRPRRPIGDFLTGSQTAPDRSLVATAHWDSNIAAKSQKARATGDNRRHRAGTALIGTGRFAGLSRSTSTYRDSLKIVVSPVRVRVSPSQEVPANRLHLVAKLFHKMRDYAPRMRVESQTKSHRPTARRCDALTAAHGVAP